MNKTNAVKRRLSAVTAGLLVTVGAIGQAAAALPASVGTSIAAIQTDGQAIFDLVFPVVAALLGLTIVIKLFKRFSKQA